MSEQVNEQLYFRLLVDYCFNRLKQITAGHSEWNQQSLAQKFSISFLQTPAPHPPPPPSPVNKTPLDYHWLSSLFLSSFFFLSFIISASLSLLPPSPPNALLVYVFPSSSLALVIASCLLKLSLSQSVSLLSCFLMCESSLGVLLYFLGSAVVDWNGGLCHFYLLPHWFHNSVCACVCTRTCPCVFA